MKSSGVTVRPIPGSEARHELNDVFFDAVQVPIENLVGRENDGWNHSRFLLNEERFGSADIGRAKRRLDLLRELVSSEPGTSLSLSDSLLWQRSVAELSVRLAALESLCVDLIGAVESDRDGRLEASIIKIVGSELAQSLTGTLLSIVARTGLRIRNDVDADDLTAAIVREHLHERAASIYSGSNEVQRNIVARMLFAASGPQ
jgi:alkylation response protein AidB-like acyl-CoA dehydrogenase